MTNYAFSLSLNGTTTNLTTRECNVLLAIFNNEYSDGTLDCRPWSWSVCGDRSRASVLGSVTKKGLVAGQGTGNDASCWFTEAGKLVVAALRAGGVELEFSDEADQQVPAVPEAIADVAAEVAEVAVPVSDGDEDDEPISGAALAELGEAEARVFQLHLKAFNLNRKIRRLQTKHLKGDPKATLAAIREARATWATFLKQNRRALGL